QAKVTDFGIARAMSAPEDNLTQAGSVMGTATYFSPEQAQGLPVDQRSDLYSLGVVLFEMVTGRTPFTGETPLAIAYKHVQDQPPSPSTIVPAIPSGLEAVIMKLLRKRPEDRYASADDVRADLRRFLNGHATLAEQERDAAAGAPTAAVAAATAATATTDASDLPVDLEDDEPSRTGLYLGILAVLLIVLSGLLFWFARGLGNGGKVDVPAVIGLMKDEATAQLDELGFKVEVTEEPSDTIAEGRVAGQNPGPGTSVAKGSTVRLSVSSGVEKFEVPDVVGRTQEEAVNALSDAGFKVRVTSVENPDGTEGTVETQRPAAGERVPKDTEVVIEIIKGSGEEIVPDVEGVSLADAENALESAGFVVGRVRRESSATVPAGSVISTDPAAGTSVPTGTTVRIVVSTGVEQVAVPYLRNQTESTAVNTLTARGFDHNVETTTVPAGDPSVGRVVSQSPAAGTTAPSGSTVTITIGVAAGTTSSSTTSTSSP
ncbi:MAG: PASTA domain-containing protein, partial [Actinomycetes bacterium]